MTERDISQQAWTEEEQSEFMIQVLETREKIDYIAECLSEQHWNADLLREIHCDLMSAQVLIQKSASLVKNGYTEQLLKKAEGEKNER